MPETLNILSTGGFIFFLLILSIGYIMVEIIIGEKYPFRKQLKINNNSVLDRFIHYIVIGILSNIGFFFILYITNYYIPFVQIFEDSGNIGKGFSEFFGINILSFQLIWSSLFYFLFIIIILFCIRFSIPYTWNNCIELYKISFSKSKKKKKKKKKSS